MKYVELLDMINIVHVVRSKLVYPVKRHDHNLYIQL